MTEQWRAIAGFEGQYEVSDLGRVRSLDRRVAIGKNWRIVRGRIRKLKVERNGYLRVNLSLPGAGYTYASAHRLVLEAFVGPCPPGMQGLHADDDKTNNRPGNLSWGTHAQNMADMVTRKRAARGHRHGKAAFSEEIEQWVRESPQGPYVLAGVLGVTQKVIYRVRAGGR